MRTHRAQLLSNGHGFLEAPRWHQNELWTSDLQTNQVKAIDLNGSSRVVLDLTSSPSGLGFLPDGSALIVEQKKRLVLRLSQEGGLETFADFSGLVENHGNDMHVGTDGNVWIGNYGSVSSSGEWQPTRLVHVGTDRACRLTGGEVIFPNGMAETRAGELLVAETFAHRITAFGIDPDGSLTRGRVWASLPQDLRPDGIALDCDGGLWFGSVMAKGGDNAFYRVLEGGEITDQIPVRGAWAVAPAFGGDNLSTLFLLCNETSIADALHGRSKGYVSIVNVGRRGINTLAI